MIDYEKELELFRKYADVFHQTEPEPELNFTPRGNPDPRLVQLARLLGRQAAREYFDAETRALKERSSRSE
ncbi:hypothetical protein SAMN05216452_3396 [Nitratireductor aquibiodomus]|uniref:Uncharacterized protein n=1 Tax=Nitratireductor aquibiodomus TaxID=204799 RepID=A0A1H4MMR4_9HYPH|nr:hypothetical protein SAMN05216452_3396 [Nitratireductor aquibiodomus]